MNIYKRGNVYRCKFRVDTKLYQFSYKTKDKHIAEDVASTIHSDIIRNIFTMPSKHKTDRLFGNIWQEYLKTCSSIKATKDRISLSKHFLPVFQDKDIQNISRIDIENYQLKRKLEILSMQKNTGKRESEITFRTANMEISIMRTFFNYCIKRELTDKNPCAGIKKLNELSRLKTLSDADIDKLIAGATNKLTRDLISFLILTGCRKGEALNLKWDNTDMQNDIIAIKKHRMTGIYPFRSP
jgi:integrase